LVKQLQRYIHEHMPKALPMLQRLSKTTVAEYPDKGEFDGVKRCWRRRVSYQTLLAPKRVARQLTATSLEEFLRLEPPQSKDGKPLYHCQPRVCVNLRQLLKTGTIEFRHFAGTLDENILMTCFVWVHRFMHHALSNGDFNELLEEFKFEKFPMFLEYNHELEKRYRATVHDGTVDKAQIVENINTILLGGFQ
jgi:hypothetical protein